MKKLIAGLFAATMLAAGLVTVSAGTPAQAACVADKYNPNACAPVTVTTKAPKKVKKGKKATITVSYASPGSGTKANVTITLSGKAKGTKTFTNVNPSVLSKFVSVKLKKKGTVKITVTVTPTSGAGSAKTLVYTFKVA